MRLFVVFSGWRSDFNDLVPDLDLLERFHETVSFKDLYKDSIKSLERSLRAADVHTLTNIVCIKYRRNAFRYAMCEPSMGDVTKGVFCMYIFEKENQLRRVRVPKIIDLIESYRGGKVVSDDQILLFVANGHHTHVKPLILFVTTAKPRFRTLKCQISLNARP